MNEEESLLSEVDSILEEAGEQEAERYKMYVRSVALRVEQTIHDEYGSQESYQLWTLGMEHKGTPESIAEFKKDKMFNDPNAVNVTVDDHDGEINSCLEMAIAFAFDKDKDMPDDLNGLLDNKKAMLLAHGKVKNLVGFVARTGAWASAKASKSSKRPSKESDRQSITLTVYYTSNMMVVVPRDDESGNVMEDAIQIVDVFAPSKDTKDRYNMTNAEVSEACANFIDENHGRTLASLYQAYAYPKSLMYDDQELYQATINDALSTNADGENNNQGESHDN